MLSSVGSVSHLPGPSPAELPVRFSRVLQDVVATAKEKVTLTCELSRPNVDVRWLKVCPSLGFCHDGWELGHSLALLVLT